ncbi:MAG: hypothetical protein KJI71_03840 [Patescibacteria group bacterium]|nr:hypothetical protein [Patescibacteria group bacterium]
MEKEIITKEIAEKLIQIKGEGRGVHFKNDADYILKEEGKEALKKVEEETERLGFPIKYKEIKNTGFYPAGLRAVSLLAIQKALGWDDEKIRGMCKAAVGASLIVRVFMKFLYPVLKAINIAPRMWREYWTEGSFKVVDYNEKEKRIVSRAEGFDLHPIYCYCLEGFFEGMATIILGAKKAKSQETKCSFKDKDEKTHEYLVKWQ